MILSLCLFFLVNFVYTFRQFHQIKELKTIQVLVVTQCAFLWLVLFSQILYVNDKIDFLQYSLLLKPVIVGLFSIYLTFVCLLSIQDVTKKKIQTLWRVPILGILAGFYFDWKYITYICIGYSFVALFVVLRERSRLNYLIKNIFIGSILAILTYFLKPQGLVGVNIFCVLFIIGISPVVRMSNISSMFQIKEKK